MKHYLIALLSLAFFSFSNSIFAQNPSRVTIKGIVSDTTGEATAYATVMLLNPKDSTLLNFTRSDEKGGFDFKNVKNVPYLLKVSYVGHLPLQQYLPASSTEIHDVGMVKIKPITSELLEVVVKAAKATLSIRGDTIEYDASSFKVPPGSTVEDLLRRLPGIDVDADGNITAQGKDVKRVYVDGKTFFGDDPKAATKNLGAETISKVQVYNEASEQSKLTGVDDGKKEKAMNLELKEEYKKGAFGKLTAAVGTEERWAGRGSYNRFNKVSQLSFIGFANNVNQTGVNWEDYGEFKGQSTFSGYDNGDFGFSSGGNRYFTIGGDDSPMGYFDGRGFSENAGAGVNYNYDRKKTKFNASYFYKQADLSFDQSSERFTFVSPDTTVYNTDTLTRDEFRGSHSMNARVEHDIDSSNLLVFKVESRISNSDWRNIQAQYFAKNESPLNSTGIDNNSATDAWRVASSGIFRHRFKKKGRSLAISAGYNSSENDGEENLNSITQIFNASDPNQQIRAIRQQNASANASQQYKSSALFTESFSKKWYWENFVNYSKTKNQVDRQTTDPENNGQRLDALSVYYEQEATYARLGSSMRYSHNGANLSFGLAAQQIELGGQYSVAKGLPLLEEPLRQRFFNVVPNVEAEYEFENDVSINFNYGYTVNEPALSDLQPVRNVNNPAFRSEGNPDLKPGLAHSLGFDVHYWNSSSLANYSGGIDLTLNDRQIAYSQQFLSTDTTNLFITRPVNVEGGYNLSGRFWSSFPIIKTKLSVNLSPNASISRTPTFVNGVENQTENQNFNLRLGFSLTPTPKLIAGLSGNARLNNVHYTVNSEQDQKIRSYSTDASIKWQFAKKSFFESNVNFFSNQNDRFDFTQEQAIWNASVRQLIGKNNRVEVRLAAFDLLNQRLTVNQYAQQNYVVYSLTPTLARYFMLSLSYSVRGYESKLNKNNWW